MANKTAATEDEVGTLHSLLTKRAKLLLESKDPEDQAEGQKLALELIKGSKITAIPTDLIIEPQTTGNDFRQQQRQRFADQSNVLDLAEERAKKAASDE